MDITFNATLILYKEIKINCILPQQKYEDSSSCVTLLPPPGCRIRTT